MQYIQIAPPEAAQTALQSFVVPDTRAAIELAVESFLARLDELDGDSDLECTADLENDLSDYEPDDDAQGDPSWPEWMSLAGGNAQVGCDHRAVDAGLASQRSRG